MLDTFFILLSGVGETMSLTAASLLIGLVGGIPLSLLRRSPISVARICSSWFIEIVRSIPPLIWIFIIFYGVRLPFFHLDPFAATVIALGVVTSTYMAEIYRSGVEYAVIGQLPAANALGLPTLPTYVYIILPQALRVIITPATTFAVSLLKDSALASVVGVSEVTFLAFQQTQITLQGLTIFSLTGVIYLSLGLPIAFAGKALDVYLTKKFV